MPLVSVIIPIYNRIDYIRAAINSVLEQTYKDYEIIVVNDGSSIDVLEALAPYKDKIVYLYHQENKGIAAARNTGIKGSKGKYIALLDEDDLFEPQKLEVPVPILENNPEVGFVYSDSYLFNSKNADLQLVLAVGRDNTEKFAHTFFLKCDVAPPSTLIRRTCIEKVGFFDDISPHDDGDLFLRIALRCRVKFSDYPSARVRDHDNRTSLNKIEMYKAVIKSWEKILSTNSEFKNSLGVEAGNKLSELYFKLGMAYVNKNMMKDSIAPFKSSRRLSKKYVNIRSMFTILRNRFWI